MMRMKIALLVARGDAWRDGETAGVLNGPKWNPDTGKLPAR